MDKNDTRLVRRPDWLSRDVWPFETCSLKIDGIRLAVTDVGTGPTLLFAHTGVWSFIWRDLIAKLSTHFRCICFDAPGTGLSERISRSEMTLECAAAATTGLIRALDLQRFTLIAHDLGGSTGLGAIATLPRRVVGIVAMNTFAWLPDVRALRGMLSLMGSDTIRRVDALTGFMGWIGSSTFGAGRHFNAASRRAFRQGASGEARAAFHQYMRSALHSAVLYQRIHDALTSSLADVPFLTVFGEHNDPFGFQQRWRTLFPLATQVVVAGGHHFPMCDAPELVAHAIGSWHATSEARVTSTGLRRSS